MTSEPLAAVSHERSSARVSRLQVTSWPVLRTLRSTRFRTLLAALLLALGLAMLTVPNLARVADPAGQFGVDFADYRTASLRMLAGDSPYAEEMLAGPIAPAGTDRYRYPPPFAQLITPIAVLPFQVGALLWLLIQAGMLFAAAWMGASAAGAPRSLERLAWTAVTLVFFLPVFGTLWTGNVEGLLAFSVGLLLAAERGGARTEAFAGVTGAVVSVVKLTPAAVLPAILRKGRPWASGVWLGLGLQVVPSLLLAPGAWADYGRVLPNLLAGDPLHPLNLAPAVFALNAGAPPFAADLIRAASLVVAIALIAGSFWWSRRAWPMAVASAVVASLLVPPVIWAHYLTTLLPLGAFAWFARPSWRLRASLVVAGALFAVGLAAQGASFVGMLLLWAAILYGLSPGGPQGTSQPEKTSRLNMARSAVETSGQA